MQFSQYVPFAFLGKFTIQISIYQIIEKGARCLSPYPFDSSIFINIFKLSGPENFFLKLTYAP